MVYAAYASEKVIQSHRALLLGGALLLGTTALAGYSSWRSSGRRFTPAGWSISLRAPAGFRQLAPGDDADDALGYEFAVSPGVSASVHIARYPCQPGEKPADIALEVWESFFPGSEPPPGSSSAVAVGPFAGTQVRILGPAGYPFWIVRAVVAEDVEAYAFTLVVQGNPRTAGIANRRFDALTQSVRRSTASGTVRPGS